MEARRKAILTAIEILTRRQHPPTADERSQAKVALQNLAENYYADIASRQCGRNAAAQLLGDWNASEQLDPGDLNAAARLVVKALEVRPIGAAERSLFASLCLTLSLLDASESEVGNTLSAEPGVAFQDQVAAVAWSKYSIVTDKQVRVKALRQIVEVCRSLTVIDAANFWMPGASLVRWHFLLGIYSLELLDYQTAQKSFETCVARRHRPIESLQWLCLVYYRCGAFEEAEGAYRRLATILKGYKSELLGLTQKFQDREEEYPPAFNWALAANHTAAALAEQGLAEAAGQRWKEGKAMGDEALEALRQFAGGAPEAERAGKMQQVANLGRWLEAAQTLCRGAILLNAGRLSEAAPDPAESKPEEQAGKDLRVARLKQAIACFRGTIEMAFDSTLRADANYRTGVACEALARLDDPNNAAEWRARAEDVLQNAERADRRDEYTVRIQDLRQKLTPGTAGAR